MDKCWWQMRGGKLWGFVAVLIEDNKSGLFRVNRYGYISDIGVDRDKRGLGVGRLLMNETEEYLRSRGVTYIKVEVIQANQGARRFYARLGFKPYEETWIKRI